MFSPEQQELMMRQLRREGLIGGGGPMSGITPLMTPKPDPLTGKVADQAAAPPTAPMPPPQMGGHPQMGPPEAGPGPMGPPPPPQGGGSVFDNPEAVGAVLGMGGRNRELEYAKGLREQEAPQGRYVSGGRIYTAANPLEHISRGVANYKGHKMTKNLEEEQMDAKKKLIEALRGR